MKYLLGNEKGGEEETGFDTEQFAKDMKKKFEQSKRRNRVS